MLPEYKKLIDNAFIKKASTKKLFEKLKKQKPANLDRVINQLHDNAFDHIDCLQCANCCHTTGPLLKNKDIERLANHFNTKPSTFTESYLRIDEDNDYVFKKMPCPFLGSDNYCTVYESKPGACANYPHTQQREQIKKLKITYYNSMICPAVAEVVDELFKIYKQ